MEYSLEKYKQCQYYGWIFCQKEDLKLLRSLGVKVGHRSKTDNDTYIDCIVPDITKLDEYWQSHFIWG